MPSERVKKKKDTNHRYLCDDILFPILLNLPTESVLRFTCVSRSWNALIRSSDFVSAHDRLHRRRLVKNTDNDDDDNSRSCLVYMPDDKRKWAQICTLIREIGGAPPRNQAYNLPLLRLSGGYRVIGVCEGLICLRKSKSDICVWNPCVGTLKTIRIPNPGPGLLFGFGFCYRSDDYRVVKMNSASFEVEVYSLAGDSWRRIGNCGFVGWRCLSSQVFSEGVIYWLAKRGRDFAVLSFDVGGETFEEMDPPMQLSGNLRTYELVVISGFFVILKVGSSGNGMIHVWGCVKKEKLKRLPSESGLSRNLESRWLPPQRFIFANDASRQHLTRGCGGRIVFEDTKDRRIFAYDCHCDGNELSFRLRDLGIHRTSSSFHLIPIRMRTLGLYLLDKVNKNGNANLRSTLS